MSSKKVYLRAPEPDDFETLSKLYQRSRRHFTGYANSTFTRGRFDSLVRDADLEGNKSYLICRLDDESIVGTINVSQIFRKSFQNAYLGYQLFAGCTGNGYIAEAVGIVIRHAFINLGLHRLEANVQPQNRPSIAVVRRNGFTKEGFSRRYLKVNGRWRDHERWAILKEDWLSDRKNGRSRRESNIGTTA